MDSVSRSCRSPLPPSRPSNSQGTAMRWICAVASLCPKALMRSDVVLVVRRLSKNWGQGFPSVELLKSDLPSEHKLHESKIKQLILVNKCHSFKVDASHQLLEFLSRLSTRRVQSIPLGFSNRLQSDTSCFCFFWFFSRWLAKELRG